MELAQELVAFTVILLGWLLLLSRLEQQQWLGFLSFAYFLHVPLCVTTTFMPSIFKTLMSYATVGELEANHIFLYQVMVTGLLGASVTTFLNRTSRDPYTRVALFFGFFVHSALWAVTTLLLPSPEEDKDGKPVGVSFVHIELGYYKFIALTVVHAVAILLAKDFFGHSQLNSRLNMHLKIDFFVNFLLGITIFAYAQRCIGFLTGDKSFDQFEILLTQLYASLLIGSAILSLLYTSVLMANNKRNLLTSRVLETLAVISLFLYASFVTNTALSGPVQVTMFIYALISFNALLGYYSPHETDSYVSNKDE